jgi:serine/threonine protein kinase
MLCAHCATPVPDQASFCYSCGSVVSDAEEEALAPAAMTVSSFTDIEELLRKETTGVYQIERLLGRGGMAVVYLAREVHLARHVAIKVLPPTLTFGHGVERFKREAKTAAALDHPHIIPIYRVSTGGSLFWYAMKYLEGESLEQLLRTRGRLTLPETLAILTQVAEALDYAHDHQVVHRDMKPANVMLDQRQRVIVTDFGIAKALSEGKLTATGSVIGTPNFMSPEQGMGGEVTGASDQYSVAVMAYRMLAGCVPFEGDSALDILHRHCTTPPPPLEAATPGLPHHVHVAVHRGLDKDPERRFPTVSAMVEAMREASTAASSGIAVPVADPTAATLLVGGAPSGPVAPATREDIGSTTSPLRIGKGLPGRPRRRADEDDPANTGERWRYSGERVLSREEPRAEPPPAALSGEHRARTSSEQPALRDEPAPALSGERRRPSIEQPRVHDEPPAMSSAERRAGASWERRVIPDRRRPPEPEEPRGRRSGDRPVIREERTRQTPVEWLPRADDPPAMPSGEHRRRPSGGRPAPRDERIRRASGGWSPHPEDNWSPEPDDWPPYDSDERPRGSSVALRRWQPPDGTGPFDERPPRWRVGSRHRLRHKPRKRRLPIPLLVGLATIFGGGVGAAGLLTWEAVAAPMGTLVIDNLPLDASVLVDAKPADRQVIRLSPGTHQLEILAPGMESHRELVKISARTTVRVRAPQRPLEPPDVE